MNKILKMNEWKTRVNEVYSMVRICKMHSKKEMDYVSEKIYSELNRKHAGNRYVYPAYIKGYVQGLIDAQRESIWRNDVEFCYLVDGILYSTHKDSSRRKTEEFYQVDKGYILNDCPNGHIWKDSDKVFTGFEDKTLASFLET